MDQQRRVLSTFIDLTERSIYYLVPIGLALGVEDKGFITLVRKDLPPAKSLISPEEGSLNLLPQLIDNESRQTDQWTIRQSQLVIARMAKLLDEISLDTKDPKLRERLQPLVEQATAGFYLGRLAQAKNRIARGDQRLVPDIVTHLQAAERLTHQCAEREEEAALPMMWGLMARLQGDEAAAQQWFQKALQLWNHPDNPANKLLTEEEKTRSMRGTGLARWREH